MSETYSAEYPASKKPRLFACHVCGCGPAREDGGVELFRVSARAIASRASIALNTCRSRRWSGSKPAP